MRKIFLFIPLIILAMTAIGQSAKSFYDFKVQTIDGADFSFSSLKGKKVMIINTASKCGNTPQYADLEKLYQNYGGDKFVIIGFPANNFGAQEPGSNTEIKEFCTKNYGVTFPMMSKISVKGSDMHELYKWLTSKSQNGVLDSEVKWNFQKYLVDETGKLVKVIDPRVNPMDPVIVGWLSSK